MEFNVVTDAKTSKDIVVEASEDFTYYKGWLDYDPDGIDDSIELLDVEIVEGDNPFISKLYKVPANDIFNSGFTVIFTYAYDNSSDESLYFPADFQTSTRIKDFDDVKNDPMQWIPEAALLVAYGGDVDYTRFLAEDYGYDDDDDE